jgi:hypothetical protein
LLRSLAPQCYKAFRRSLPLQRDHSVLPLVLFGASRQWQCSSIDEIGEEGDGSLADQCNTEPPGASVDF